MRSESPQCVILFRDQQCQFRALYSVCPDTGRILRLCGTGPKLVSREMVSSLYKYNSDRKSFQKLPSRTLSASVDALTVHEYLWQSRKKLL
eukprot:g15746.t1